MSDGDVVATLMAIAGCTEEEAIGYLTSADFDLATAHSLCVADKSSPPQSVPQPASPPSEASMPGSPGYATPPYLISRLDGGGTRNNFSAAPHGPREPPRPPGFMQQPQDRDASATAALFTAPAFVHQGTTSFTDFCVRALGKDQWVLLSIIGDDFASMCVNRDIWCSEGARETLNMFSIYQVSASAEHGIALANGYRIDLERSIPALLIVNPLTTMKELHVPLNFAGEGGMDVGEVNEMILSFIAERGSPSQWEEKKQTTHDAPSALGQFSSSQARVEEDSAEDSSVIATSQPQPERSVEKPKVEAVDLSQYEVDASQKNAFSLRCRLPKTQMTLRLKPETPAHLLVKYLAYRAYKDQPEVFPDGVPNCSLKAGYPPKELDVGDERINLDTCGALRSGDNVFLHIQ